MGRVNWQANLLAAPVVSWVRKHYAEPVTSAAGFVNVGTPTRQKWEVRGPNIHSKPNKLAWTALVHYKKRQKRQKTEFSENSQWSKSNNCVTNVLYNTFKSSFQGVSLKHVNLKSKAVLYRYFSSSWVLFNYYNGMRSMLCSTKLADITRNEK